MAKEKTLKKISKNKNKLMWCMAGDGGGNRTYSGVINTGLASNFLVFYQKRNMQMQKTSSQSGIRTQR